MDHLSVIRSFIGKTFTASPSPFMQWLAPIIVDAAAGKVEMQYRVRPEWLNPAGNLHGGVTAAIIDDAIGATMFTLNEPYFYTTINNTIDYLSAAGLNDELIAETMIIKQGRQFAHVQCNIWNAGKSRLIAKGSSNLFKTENKREK